MADERSLEEKLIAMRDQAVSPRESELARAALERLYVSRIPAPRIQTPGILTRAQILAAPNRSAPAGTVRVRLRDGTVIVLSEDERELVW